MEIIPIRAETSERQMMVYFPEHHLLYGSNPFQKLPDGSYFYPQTVTELTNAVTREHLQPERFFLMHLGPTSWTELQKAITAAGSKNTPDGTLFWRHLNRSSQTLGTYQGCPGRGRAGAALKRFPGQF